jgi:hypothetical protein
MVYTEYFVRGTQPQDECPLHPGASFFDRIAGLFGRDSDPPASADQAGVSTTAAEPPSSAPPRAAESRESSVPREETAEKPKRKRGFWARVFGVGKDDDDAKDERDDRSKASGQREADRR